MGGRRETKFRNCSKDSHEEERRTKNRDKEKTGREIVEIFRKQYLYYQFVYLQWNTTILLYSLL
jgi:hypothetical protein